jgi:hypothetical protein
MLTEWREGKEKFERGHVFSEAPPRCLLRPRRCRRDQRGPPSVPSLPFFAVLSRCLSLIFRFLCILHISSRRSPRSLCLLPRASALLGAVAVASSGSGRRTGCRYHAAPPSSRVPNRRGTPPLHPASSSLQNMWGPRLFGGGGRRPALAPTPRRPPRCPRISTRSRCLARSLHGCRRGRQGRPAADFTAAPTAGMPTSRITPAPRAPTHCWRTAPSHWLLSFLLACPAIPDRVCWFRPASQQIAD